MDSTIPVMIPIDADGAGAFDTPPQRQAAGRYLSGLLRSGRIALALAEAMGEAKQEARTGGLTDADVDAEMESWRAERRG